MKAVGRRRCDAATERIASTTFAACESVRIRRGELSRVHRLALAARALTSAAIAASSARSARRPPARARGPPRAARASRTPRREPAVERLAERVDRRHRERVEQALLERHQQGDLPPHRQRPVQRLRHRRARSTTALERPLRGLPRPRRRARPAQAPGTARTSSRRLSATAHRGRLRLAADAGHALADVDRGSHPRCRGAGRGRSARR